jgi:hypothetical protein
MRRRSFYTANLFDKFENNFSAFFRLIAENIAASRKASQSVLPVVTPGIPGWCYGRNFAQQSS